MKATRRQVLIGAGAGAAALGTVQISGTEPNLVVFDSRLKESHRFAAQFEKTQTLDIAKADERMWAEFRALNRGSVVGLTGWSDWVLVRGFLEERGLRLKSEAAVKAVPSGAAHLFRWEMA